MAHAHAQSLLGAVKPVTPMLFIAYTPELYHGPKKKLKKNIHLEMRNLKLTELQRLKNRGKKV